MAIYHRGTTSASRTNGPVASQGINIETWTEQAAQSLNTLSIASPRVVRGTTVSLAIDLDGHGAPKPAKPGSEAYRPRNKLLRRDSLERREALLKGKEGSRRRTRWENDRLLNNPWAQPPLPSDWEVRPTYPRHSVPYYLAPLWDQELAAEHKQKQRSKEQKRTPGQGDVPRELREKLKRAKAARGLLRALEEQVRLFVNDWEKEKHPPLKRKADKGSADSELNSSDEDIVFIGRKGKMRDQPPSPKLGDGEDSTSSEPELQPRKRAKTGFECQQLVFDSPANDRSAGFGRWLVHNIAQYYGLRTWSRTIGDPARREAYVGLPLRSGGTTETRTGGGDLLPRPLWGMV